MALLKSDGTQHGVAESIFIQGNDVYAAVSEDNGPDIIGTYWKNDTAVKLRAGTIVNSIFVFENDIYVAGYGNFGTGGSAKYWKNGVIVDLTDDQRSSQKVYLL